MGRNSIPKLEEWRDGKLYRFRAHNGPYDKDKPPYPQPSDGRMIVYERVTRKWKNGEPHDSDEVLACAYADGFQDVMAAMWQDGYHKGERAGYERAKAEIRGALGLPAIAHKEQADAGGE